MYPPPVFKRGKRKNHPSNLELKWLTFWMGGGLEIGDVGCFVGRDFGHMIFEGRYGF